MSKDKKEKEATSIIDVRTMCDICKKVDVFQIPTKELLPHIGGLYQVSTLHQCKEDKEMVMTIVLDRNHAVRQTTVSPFVAEREVERWSPEKVADIKFLVKQIRDADRIFHAVLAGRVVVIASTNMTFVKRIIHTLELFSPTKYPQSIDWTTQLVKDKKIIGTTPKLAEEYKGAVIANLDTNKIANSKPSNYGREFLDDLITLEPKGMAYAARLRIAMLVEFAKMIIELSKEPDIGPKVIDLVRMDVSADALELILDIVHGFDPTTTEIIKENWL
ncbi:MAG: hypothetical protein KGD59_11840 [Candidatus Heimdallarchaeota archaeon]|nr:hypothetical protein [Candidatus Heimdallarchaeota archaeon]MBY8995235.1 hypothetical protein [Candidatus Heimdallarchaeota archaeon]